MIRLYHYSADNEGGVERQPHHIASLHSLVYAQQPTPAPTAPKPESNFRASITESLLYGTSSQRTTRQSLSTQREHAAAGGLSAVLLLRRCENLLDRLHDDIGLGDHDFVDTAFRNHLFPPT